MINYKHKKLQFEESIDPKIFANTLGVLQKGHYDALQTNSNLHRTIAELDLNESEEGFRQKLLSDIDKTITENTIDDNAYYSLGALIKKQGDIFSNKGLIDRLKSQQAYKSYMSQIDNDKSLTEDQKSYYREHNPYYYTEKLDNKGKTISSEIFQPKEKFTENINLAPLIQRGIQMAAVESGGSNQVYFLDENGNATPNYNESATGEVFMNINGKSQRLSPEKIRAGIEAMINNTPGARESIEQDYKVSKWKHEKNSKSNGEPYVSDITDKNGVILSKNQWFERKIAPAIYAAKFNNFDRQVSYGNALASHRKMQSQRAAIEQSKFTDDDKAIISSGERIEIKAPESIDYKNLANNKLKEFSDNYKKVTGREFRLVGDNIGDIESELVKKGYSPTIIDKLSSIADEYNYAINSYNNIYKSYGDKEREIIDLYNRLNLGESFKSSKNGGTKREDKLISNVNKVWGDKSELVVNINNEKTLADLSNQLRNSEFGEDVKLSGNQLIIKENAKYFTPVIFSMLDKSKNRTNNIIDKFTDIFGNSIYDIKDIDKESISIGGRLISKKPIYFINEIASEYNNIEKDYNKIKNSNNRTILVDSKNIKGGSFTHREIIREYERGLIDEKTFNAKNKIYNEQFNRALINTGLDGFDIYGVNEKTQRKTKINEVESIGVSKEILQAAKDNRLEISPTVLYGTLDKKGLPLTAYNLSIIPKDKETKGEAIKKYTISGSIIESAGDNYVNKAEVKTLNDLIILNNTKSSKTISKGNRNKYLGNIVISGTGEENINITFMNNDFIVPLNKAKDFYIAIEEYKNLKSIYQIEDLNDDALRRVKGKIKNISNVLSNTFNKDNNYFDELLINDLNSPLYE